MIHTTDDRSDVNDDEILTITTIEVNAMDTRHLIHDTRDKAFAAFEITQLDKKRKINLQYKVDTGAKAMFCPSDYYA